MRYAYKRLADASLDDVSRSLVAAAASRGFVVLESHDIQASLAAKGYAISPLRIVELGLADEDADPLVSLLLPCRLNIYQEEEGVAIAALRPTLFLEVYPERDLEEVARALEDAIISVVDEACGHPS